MLLKTVKIVNKLLEPWPGSDGLKMAVMVSVAAHIIMILTVQQVVPVFWKTEEIRSYRIELVREAVDDLPVGKLEEKHEDSLKKLIDSKTESEETISLDTKDKRYVSYTKIIKKKLMSAWEYPPEAKLNLLEGKSVVLFSILRDGTLAGASITSSSGYDILDNEVVRAVNTASPFPAFPETISANKLNINASFEYQLAAKSGR